MKRTALSVAVVLGFFIAALFFAHGAAAQTCNTDLAQTSVLTQNSNNSYDKVKTHYYQYYCDQSSSGMTFGYAYHYLEPLGSTCWGGVGAQVINSDDVIIQYNTESWNGYVYDGYSWVCEPDDYTYSYYQWNDQSLGYGTYGEIQDQSSIYATQDPQLGGAGTTRYIDFWSDGTYTYY